MARNTQHKIDFILANYQTKTMSEMAEDLGTSISGVYYLGVKLGIINEMKRARLTPARLGESGPYEKFIQYIIDHHQDMTCSEMAAALDSSHSRVYHHIKRLGLTDTLKRPAGARYHKAVKQGYFNPDAVVDKTWLI